MSAVPATLINSEYAFQGPSRGADRAVLLAHGAGADMHAAALTAVADALADNGVPSLRFQYPYRSQGKRPPDRPAVLLASTREAAAELARRSKLPPDRVVLGGRSMGGRYCSMIASDVVDPVPCMGLLLLGYPLHPAGKPERERSEHFPRLTMPVHFVSGTRDALAPKTALTKASRKIKGTVTWCWIETGDHGFKPLVSSGHSIDDVLREAADASSEWVSRLTL